MIDSSSADYISAIASVASAVIGGLVAVGGASLYDYTKSRQRRARLRTLLWKEFEHLRDHLNRLNQNPAPNDHIYLGSTWDPASYISLFLAHPAEVIALGDDVIELSEFYLAWMSCPVERSHERVEIHTDTLARFIDTARAIKTI